MNYRASFLLRQDEPDLHFLTLCICWLESGDTVKFACGRAGETTLAASLFKHQSKYVTKYRNKKKLSTTDLLALASMKNAAKCDK